MRPVREVDTENRGLTPEDTLGSILDQLYIHHERKSTWLSGHRLPDKPQSGEIDQQTHRRDDAEHRKAQPSPFAACGLRPS